MVSRSTCLGHECMNVPCWFRVSWTGCRQDLEVPRRGTGPCSLTLDSLRLQNCFGLSSKLEMCKAGSSWFLHNTRPRMRRESAPAQEVVARRVYDAWILDVLVLDEDDRLGVMPVSCEATSHGALRGRLGCTFQGTRKLTMGPYHMHKLHCHSAYRRSAAADGTWCDSWEAGARVYFGEPSTSVCTLLRTRILLSRKYGYAMMFKEPSFMHNTATMHHVQLVMPVASQGALADTVHTFRCVQSSLAPRMLDCARGTGTLTNLLPGSQARWFPKGL